MSKGENIVKWIKGRRISWLGHVERMKEDRVPKKSSLKNWKGRGWKGDVGRDLQVLGVRRCRKLVTDRRKWKDVVRQSKTHSGL